MLKLIRLNNVFFHERRPVVVRNVMTGALGVRLPQHWQIKHPGIGLMMMVLTLAN